MKKVIILVGIFFIVMQFSTVIIFNKMLDIAKANGLPMEQLADMQMKIMNVVFISVIVVGLLLAGLLIGLIWNALKQPKAVPVESYSVAN